jgi:hypothetical protein
MVATADALVQVSDWQAWLTHCDAYQYLPACPAVYSHTDSHSAAKNCTLLLLQKPS